MKNEIIYMDFDQALNLVDRMADRTKKFNYTISKPESEAIASLLCDVGVTVDDLLDVSRLADNYAINAEIVNDENRHQYHRTDLEDALFTWKENNEQFYCLNW